MSSVRMKLTYRGNYKKTETWLRKLLHIDFRSKLEKYGKVGVYALSRATPVRTGKTAESWYYEIREIGEDRLDIVWSNSNVNKHVNIAVILQYGHGTRNGGYVQGIDYINPALEPIFQQIADAAFKEVTNS